MREIKSMKNNVRIYFKCNMHLRSKFTAGIYFLPIFLSILIMIIVPKLFLKIFSKLSLVNNMKLFLLISLKKLKKKNQKTKLTFLPNNNATPEIFAVDQQTESYASNKTLLYL